MRVAHRIVVGCFHQYSCSFWQDNWLLIVRLSLPQKVPILDPDERLNAAIGQCRTNLHFVAQVVHMWTYSKNLKFSRNIKNTANLVLFFSSWYVQVVLENGDSNSTIFWDRFGKVDTDFRLITFHAHAVIVILYDEISALLHKLCHI